MELQYKLRHETQQKEHQMELQLREAHHEAQLCEANAAATRLCAAKDKPVVHEQQRHQVTPQVAQIPQQQGLAAGRQPAGSFQQQTLMNLRGQQHLRAYRPANAHHT